MQNFVCYRPSQLWHIQSCSDFKTVIIAFHLDWRSKGGKEIKVFFPVWFSEPKPLLNSSLNLLGSKGQGAASSLSNNLINFCGVWRVAWHGKHWCYWEMSRTQRNSLRSRSRHFSECIRCIPFPSAGNSRSLLLIKSSRLSGSMVELPLCVQWALGSISAPSIQLPAAFDKTGPDRTKGQIQCKSSLLS